MGIRPAHHLVYSCVNYLLLYFLFEEKNLDSSFNFTLENEEYDEDIKYSVLKFFGKS